MAMLSWVNSGTIASYLARISGSFYSYIKDSDFLNATFFLTVSFV